MIALPVDAPNILSILEKWADISPEAPVILSLDQDPLTYGLLLDQVTSTVTALRSAGIQRGDCVAVVLPNGPEMAVTFLAVANAATCAPLNPGYREQEFDFYLDDLEAKALIVLRGEDSPARPVAQRRGIRIIELEPEHARASGQHRLSVEALDCGETRPRRSNPGSDDVALVLHTSGTTSRPKIVPLTHKNLVSSADNIAATLKLEPHDRCLNVMPLFHIHGLLGATLSTVVSGGSIACMPGFEAPRFLSWAQRMVATWYTAVPTIHQAVLARAELKSEAARALHLRFLRSSSAALPPQVMARLEELFKAPMIESYGMTEASHQMASNPLPPAVRKPGSVGPAAGPRVAVMNDDGDIVPSGTVAEVVIQGRNVTTGYRNNPDANEVAFSNGWFRTGDQGYLDEDGYLFLTGRLKEIINRGGEKISPREVDEVLLDHPTVAQAVAFATPHDRLGEDVAAAVVLRPGCEADEAQLREFTAARLVFFKVPQTILILDEIPKGPTGKVQRIGLAERLDVRKSDTPAVHREYVAPRGELETRLCEIWQELLDVEGVGIRDDFFALGGDSVLATMFLSRLLDLTDRRLSIAAFFNQPTIEDVTDFVGGSSEPSTDNVQPIGRKTHGSSIPMSTAQRRIWFLQEFEQEKAAWNRPLALRLSGPLDCDAMQRSLSAVCERHDVLRSRFVMQKGVAAAQIRRPRDVDLPMTDLTGQEEKDRQPTLEQIAVQEALRPFLLEDDLLLRAQLVKMDAEDHVLLLTAHHIVSDGWSTTVLLENLAAFYNAYSAGTEPDLPPLPIQFADYAAWHNEYLEGPAVKAQLEYWSRRLRGPLPVLDLPIDSPRPSHKTYQGKRAVLTLPEDLIASLKALNREHAVTMFMTLLAGFETVIHRLTGADDLVIGSPVSGRSRTETESLVGLFINTLPLRTDLTGEPSFTTLLKRTREIVLGALANQDVPFDRLVAAVNPPRILNRSAVFQVLFHLRNVPGPRPRLYKLKLSKLEIDAGIAEHDLSLEVQERPEGIHCALTYNSDIIDPSTAQRFLESYQRVLRAAAHTPATRIRELPILSETELALLQDWSRGPEIPIPNQCLHALFEAQVERTPDNVAAVCTGHTLSYSELNRRANQLAHFLRDLGSGPDDLVGLCLENSLELVVGVFGILKAGAAYVPLGPYSPPARLAGLIDKSGLKRVVTLSRFEHLLPLAHCRSIPLDDAPYLAEQPDINPPLTSGPENLAYVVHTSGSTGAPKGVLVEHRAITDYAVGLTRAHDLEGLSWAMVQTITVDSALTAFYPPLLSGGTVHLVSRHDALDAHGLARTFRSNSIDAIKIAPSHLAALNAEVTVPILPRRVLVLGGEALRTDLVHQLRLQAPHLRIINHYGPTEASVGVATFESGGEHPTRTSHQLSTLSGTAPIGRPLPNCRLFVFDAYGQQVPAGVAGELYIGGPCLARGYLAQPEATSEAFVKDPFSPDEEARLYRSGDLVRYLPGGALEFLGRADHQVKIRGFRVEPAEVESCLAAHPDVADAAVNTFTGPDGTQLLAAWVVVRTGSGFEPEKLRSHAAGMLPDHLVPASIEMMAALPRSPQGKIDRSALPQAEPVSPAPSTGKDTPRSPTEERLVQIWRELLDQPGLGIRDNFFDLGGHSLLAVRLFSRIQSELGRKVPLSLLFEAPTVEALAAHVEKATLQEESSPIVAIRRSGSRPPVFLIHGNGGSVLFYRELAHYLGGDQPVYCLQSPGFDGSPSLTSVEAMADRYVLELRAVQEHGPYRLAGYCIGAYIGLEMAHRLENLGEVVAPLISLNTDGEWRTLSSISDSFSYHLRNLVANRTIRDALDYLRRRGSYRLDSFLNAIACLSGSRDVSPGTGTPQLINVRQIRAINARANLRYAASRFSGPVHVVQAELDAQRDARAFWSGVVGAELEISTVPGKAEQIFAEPNVQHLAEELRRILA